MFFQVLSIMQKVFSAKLQEQDNSIAGSIDQYSKSMVKKMLVSLIGTVRQKLHKKFHQAIWPC